jgi:hypothetical protein
MKGFVSGFKQYSFVQNDEGCYGTGNFKIIVEPSPKSIFFRKCDVMRRAYRSLNPLNSESTAESINDFLFFGQQAKQHKPYL